MSAEALISAGESRLSTDQLNEARQLFRAARDHPQAASDLGLQLAALLGLADADIKEGRYSEAGALLDAAQEIWEQQEQPVQGARLWTLRAGSAYRQRRTGEALDYRLSAVEQARLAADPALLFQTLTNLARAYLDLHDYAAAIPVFAETATLEGQPADQVVNRIQLGISQFELNQFEEARESFENARLAAIELGSPRLEGTALGELGLVAWEESRAAERADAYFDQAIEKMHSIGDRVNVVAWRTNKALVLRETGQCQAAVSLYEELEAELASIEGQQVWPTLYKGMGQCQIELGNYDAAASSIDLCLTVARRGGDSKRIWECEQLRGRLAADSGELDVAIEAFELALAEIERLRVSLLVGRFKADFFENKLPLFQEYAQLLATRLPPREAARQSFAVSERARARAFLDEFAGVDDTLRSLVPDDLLQEEDRVLQQIRNMRAAADQGAANRRELARLETRLDEISLEARSQLPTPLAYAPSSTLEEIQAVLAPDETMLVYWLAEPASHLWRIDRDAIEHHWLSGETELESLVRDTYAALTDPSRLHDPGRLAAALLEPVRYQDNVARVLIVPSGILHYFPFEVLPLEGGGLLPDRISTSYLPSASTLVHLRNTQPTAGAPAILAVGDVAYPVTVSGEEGAGDYGPLPFSRAEVRTVARRFSWQSRDVLTGESANESRLKSLTLGSYSVLHFATHGWIDASSQEASGLVLLPGDDSQDGLLQPREIRQFELDAELVVLSACQSALGRLVTGEGMVGLTRAFLDAGARSVVASLWNVNDQASAEFMEAFYSALAGGASRGRALADARASLRGRPQYQHPFYWAAWVLVGESGETVHFPVRWERWLGGFLFFVLVGVFLVRRRNQSAI